MAQPPVVTAEMARSHRLRAHHLAAPLPPGAYCEAAAACGLQNSPPGAFETALFARVQGASPAGIRRALYEEKACFRPGACAARPPCFPRGTAMCFCARCRARTASSPGCIRAALALRWAAFP